jgi:hypothetical protein
MYYRIYFFLLLLCVIRTVNASPTLQRIIDDDLLDFLSKLSSDTSSRKWNFFESIFEVILQPPPAGKTNRIANDIPADAPTLSNWHMKNCEWASFDNRFESTSRCDISSSGRRRL